MSVSLRDSVRRTSIGNYVCPTLYRAPLALGLRMD